MKTCTTWEKISGAAKHRAESKGTGSEDDDDHDERTMLKIYYKFKEKFPYNSGR